MIIANLILYKNCQIYMTMTTYNAWQLWFLLFSIGDVGCLGICRGMEGNKSITSLSLNYCGLGIDSGKPLGHILTTTALR